MAGKSLQLSSIFLLGLVVLATIGALGGGWLVFVYQDYQKIEQRSSIAQQIVNGAFQLTTLTGEFLIYQEPRAERQWRNRHLSMSKILAEAGATGGPGNHHQQSLSHDFNRSLILFDRVVEISAVITDKKKIRPFVEFQQKRLASELLSATQSLASQASLTAKEASLAHHQATRRVTGMIGVFALVLTGVVLALWWVLALRVVRPIKNLRNDILAFGDNLNHRVGLERDDEIGTVATSFNEMSERLRETLVSRDELTKEVKERKQKEKKLRESEERFRGFINNSPSFINLKDTDGRFLLINRKHAEIFGIDASDAVGKTGSDLLPEKQAREAAIHDRKVIETKSTVTEERQFSNEQGTVDLLITKFPILDEAGAVVAVGSIGTDITARKKAEEIILASLEEKEVLLQEINHRVKNNLQVISGMLWLQANAEDNAHTVDVLHECHRRVMLMARIHESLYRQEDINVISSKDLLNTLITDTKASGGGVTDHLSYHIDVDDIPLDVDHANAYGQIVSELISNCQKHGFVNGSSGNIKVSLHKGSGGETELIVADDGKGLPEDFDFENVKTLGLHLVRSLAARLGGEVKIDRSGGTRVQINFPEQPS